MIDLLIVVLCLILNSMFSAYEMAFVTITREEVDGLQEGSSNNQKYSQLVSRFRFFKKNPERTLSVIQIGITLVGAIAAAVGGTGAVENLEPYIVSHFGFSNSVAEAIAVVVVIAPLTYFSVVFGELLPKTIALKNPVRVIILGTRLLSLIDRILSPIVSLLEISTNILLKFFGLHKSGSEDDESMGEVVEIGNLPDYHQKFVKNLVSLKGRKVLKVMIPWDKVNYLKFSDEDEAVKAKLAATPHSRYPVIDGDVVVGVLLRKDYTNLSLTDHVPWQGILRPMVRAKDTEKALEVFLRMQEKQIPICIVENSNDCFVGIVTIEDILEEIVGDINDRADYSVTSKMLSSRPKINLKKD